MGDGFDARGGQGGSGGGLAKASVWSRSSQEEKIRKAVIDAKRLKNWIRELTLDLARLQNSSEISATV